MKTLSTAPVALFVYNRLHNTRQTIEHLKKNKLADRTPLYIFSDGGKDKTSWKEVNRLRNYLHTIDGFGEVHISRTTEKLLFRKKHYRRHPPMYCNTTTQLSYWKMTSAPHLSFWNI